VNLHCSRVSLQNFGWSLSCSRVSIHYSGWAFTVPEWAKLFQGEFQLLQGGFYRKKKLNLCPIFRTRIWTKLNYVTKKLKQKQKVKRALRTENQTDGFQKKKHSSLWNK
jgi:hypothetical protein